MDCPIAKKLAQRFVFIRRDALLTDCDRSDLDDRLMTRLVVAQVVAVLLTTACVASRKGDCADVPAFFILLPNVEI